VAIGIEPVAVNPIRHWNTSPGTTESWPGAFRVSALYGVILVVISSTVVRTH